MLRWPAPFFSRLGRWGSWPFGFRLEWKDTEDACISFHNMGHSACQGCKYTCKCLKTYFLPTNGNQKNCEVQTFKVWKSMFQVSLSPCQSCFVFLRCCLMVDHPIIRRKQNIHRTPKAVSNQKPLALVVAYAARSQWVVAMGASMSLCRSGTLMV